MIGKVSHRHVTNILSRCKSCRNERRGAQAIHSIDGLENAASLVVWVQNRWRTAQSGREVSRRQFQIRRVDIGNLRLTYYDDRSMLVA